MPLTRCLPGYSPRLGGVIGANITLSGGECGAYSPGQRGRERLLDMSTVWVPVLKHENGRNYPAYKAITARSGV